MAQGELMAHRQRAAAIAARLLHQLGPGPDLSAVFAQEGRTFAPSMRGGGGGGRRAVRRRRTLEREVREQESRWRFRLLEQLGLLVQRRP